MPAISRRQRAIHEASFWRSWAISSKLRPSASITTCFPVYSWNRRQMQSAYFGSIYISRELRFCRSHAIAERRSMFESP
jgi:hypothetical protein